MWELMVEAILNAPGHHLPDFDISTWPLRLDWRVGLSLISEMDSVSRRQGAMLLILSDFPVSDAQHRGELLAAMARAQDEREQRAWARLLEESDMSPDVAAWIALLEAILAQPRAYSSAILNAALGEYRALTGAVGADITGDEVALGLPAMAA